MMEEGEGWSDRISPDLAGFLAERDSFYLGSASAEGRPYIQHRGGPPGFLEVLDEHTLAFADFGGNRQYITVGNLGENDQAFLFLMDYPNRRRVKIWGRAEVVEDDPGLLEKLSDPAYEAKLERAIRFHVEAWDVNCPQHIRPRYTREEIDVETRQLRERIEALESENLEFRRRLSGERAP
jgi:predicted pyridoxine 5'-phosphate oxidase superfamily flavin-nucleotide-binding protein